MLKISSSDNSAKIFFTSLKNHMKKLEKARLQQLRKLKLRYKFIMKQKNHLPFNDDR